MSIFADVKMQIHLPNVAEYYGIQVNRGGFASCLFHEERTPSMKLYDYHFHCYGCREHGDVIKLMGRLFNLFPYEAAQKLSHDFHIVPGDDFKQIKRIKSTQQSNIEKENYIFKILNDYCRFLEECRENHTPKNFDDDFHPLFVESLLHYEQYNYYRDIFITGTKEERIKFINDFREELYDIERRLATVVV